MALQLDAGDVLDDVDELVDGHHLAGPRLIGSWMSLSMIVCRPLMQSSMYMKLRVCLPSPQISISCLPESLASTTLRQIAAGAFSRPPSHVPSGP